MNAKTEQAIQSIIGKTAMNRPLTIATLYSSRSTLPLELARNGHRVLVVGSLFRKLYNLWKKGSKLSGSDFLILESTETELPLQKSKLDVVVICEELPGPQKKTALTMVRELLKPGGLLIWPHQSSRKLEGTKMSLVPSRRLTRRTISSLCEYTSLLMEIGFQDIGQVTVPRRTVWWTITTGKASSRPWVMAES